MLTPRHVCTHFTYLCAVTDLFWCTKAGVYPENTEQEYISDASSCKVTLYTHAYVGAIVR